MGFQFLLGTSGSGKTHFILEELTDKLANEPSAAPIVFIVPEQSTYQMEQAVLHSGKVSGFSRLHILSFQRLSRKILQEQGGYATKALTDIGKEMILRNILLQRQDELQVLNKIAKRVGFSEKLASLISEARMYEINPAQLEEVKEQLENQHMQSKLAELAVLFKDYEEFLEEGNLQHQEDQLSMAGEYVQSCEFLKDAECYIDGFSGFTPQELNIIEGIVRNCHSVKMALTLPVNFQNTVNELNLYHPVIKTYNQVLDLCRNNEINVLETDTFPKSHGGNPRFKSSEDLDHLQSQWGNNQITPFEKKPDNITIIEANSVRSEVEKIAREIKLLIRKQQFRYRDIAVIVRDMEEYEPVISAVFKDFDIPHFLDRKQEVHHHPLVELMRASIETVITDWDYEPVIRMLKTGLLPVDDEEIFLIENYLLAHGIEGKRWSKTENWNYTINYELERESDNINDQQKDYLDEINRIKNSILDVMEQFTVSLSADINKPLTVREVSTALWNLLEKLQVEKQLEKWAREAEKRQDFTEMQMHEQILGAVIELLDQMVTFLSDRELQLKEYLQIMESGLANLKLGLIPATLDQVVIGTADRSRYRDLQIMFMAGVSEGFYPMQIRDEGLINDEERLELRKCNVEFAPTTEQKLFQEQFLIYSVITQPAKYLYMSYPTADSEGKHISSSTIITRVTEIFPELDVQFQNDAPDNSSDFHEYLVDANKCITYLVKLMNNVGTPNHLAADKEDLLRFLVTNYSDEFYSAPEIKGMEYQNELSSLSKQILEKNYAETVITSVSALENFCQCPFKYFANNNLKLQERQYYKLEPASLGLFYHAGLSMFWEKLQREGLSWETISSSDSRRIIEGIVDILSQRLQNQILLSSERYKYFRKKLTELLQRTTLFLSRYCNKNGFYPIANEVSFGKNGELTGIKLQLSQAEKMMELTGRIDRVDAAELENDAYIRVIDYKGKADNLDLRKLYWGLDLQLAAYMNVAVKNGTKLVSQSSNIYPGAMLYFGVTNPVINAEQPLDTSEVEGKLKSELKMRGYLLKEPELLDSMTRTDESSQSLLPYKLKKNGQEFYKNSKVLTVDDFQSVLEFTEHKLKELGEKLLAGEISPRPFKDGNYTACSYCPYLPACQFDLNYSHHNFWQIPDRDDYLDMILDEVSEERGE